MSSDTADADGVDVADEVDEIVLDLNRTLAEIDCVPYKIRGVDETTARVLIGKNEGRVRGTLDRKGYEMRDSDVPVRDGYAALLEVSRG